MKKVLCLIVLLAFVFVSCGKASSGETIKLRGYSQLDLAHPQSKADVIILEGFKKDHPEVDIEWEYVNGEAFHQKFQAMAATGDIPDIFTLYLGARTAYITDRGLAMDIRPYLTDAVKKEFNDNIWDAQGPNGEIYFISPNLAVCHVVYVNTKLMKELGLTYPKTEAELIAQGEVIRKAGLVPFAFGNQSDWVVNSFLLSTLVDRFGGKAWFDKAMTGEAKFTDPEFVNALYTVKKLIDNKMFAPGFLQMTQPQALEEFVNGKALYLIDSGWRIPAIKNLVSEEMLEQIDMQVYPTIEGSLVPLSSSSTLGEGYGINAKLPKDKADAAMKFIMYREGKVGATIRMDNGSVPTYTLDASKFSVDPLTKKYLKFVDEVPMGYVIDAKMDAEGMGILNPAIQAMQLGKKTPSQVASEYEAWVSKNDSHRVKK